MKVYTFQRTQVIPTTLEKAWDFFSSPKNLKLITPDYLGFKITSDLGDQKMYAGQIINYVVKPVMNIPMRWTTEITQVIEGEYFIDHQVFGPYKLWHHQHFFKQLEGGIEMTDLIHYAIPLGWIGRIANGLMVEKKLKEIFDYRNQKIEEVFPN